MYQKASANFNEFIAKANVLGKRYQLELQSARGSAAYQDFSAKLEQFLLTGTLENDHVSANLEAAKGLGNYQDASANLETLVANVDLATGSVSKLIGRFWPGAEVFLSHPTTGQPVQGFKLPRWQELLDICRQGGRIFPLMKIHHWDFALTEQGPLILELNDLGSIALPQLHGHGLLSLETRKFLKQHANVAAHSWISSL